MENEQFRISNFGYDFVFITLIFSYFFIAFKRLQRPFKGA